jgi:hypothetical protein
MAAVGNLVLGHYARSTTDQNAAKALNYAEAAMNAQVQKISANLGKVQTQWGGTIGTPTWGNATYSSTLNTANNRFYAGSNNPYPVDTLFGGFLPLNSANGDYSVAWVQPAPLNLYNNDPNNPQYIYGQARINGVMRTVRAKAGSEGIFDTYALYGIKNLALGGNSVSIIGAAGTNGTVTSGDNDKTDNGLTQIVLAGPTAQNGTNSPTAANFNGITAPSATTQATTEPFPTIFQLANDIATSLKDRAAINNQTAAPFPAYAGESGFLNNNGIRNFNSTFNDNATSSDYRSTAWSGIIIKPDGKKEWDGTSTPNGSMPINGGISQSLFLIGRPWGSNFYMTGININAGGTIAVDLTRGPVNLWIESDATGGDSITGNFEVSGSNQFRIYYRNPNATQSNLNRGVLTLAGGGSSAINVNAYIYVYDRTVYTASPADPTPLGTEFGRFTITGSVYITGSVIAYEPSTVSGTVTINLPTNPGASAGEGILFYGLTSPWQEYDPVRGY